MNDLYALDYSLNFLNESKMIDPISIMLEGIDRELYYFNSIINPFNIVLENENSSLNYIIDVNEKAVGFIGLHWRARECTKHTADFNYWLGKKYWGQGIMTEAIKVLCDYAFNELNKLKLSITTLEDNIGSRKVAEKNGFKFECITEKDVFKEGKYKNLVYYGKFNPKYKVINEK